MNPFTIALTSALGAIGEFVPKLLGALFLLLLGYLLGRALALAVTAWLRRIHLVDTLRRAGLLGLDRVGTIGIDLASVFGSMVYWFIFLIFLILAINSLGLTAVAAVLNQIIAYTPNVVAAFIILVLLLLLANFAADLIRGAATTANLSNGPLLATLARYSITILAILAALQQLNIATTLITILFTAIVAALALGVGISFGLGSADITRNLIAGRFLQNKLRPGQRITIADVTGVVIESGPTTTMINTPQGKRVLLPNATLATKEVTMG